MHGIGNDYVYFDAFDDMPENASEIAVRLSDRHRSVGGDGVIFVTKSEIADGGMRMFNADGSEGKMCGNGVRCVGKFLYDVKGVKKDVITVETLSGVKRLHVHLNRGDATSFTVEMGRAELEPEKIPCLFDGDRVVGEKLLVADKLYFVTCVSMGNPHCVVFEDPDGLNLEEVGAKFENHPAFPERVNTEFIKVIGKNELKMRVWERGSGETFACGTGACAAAVASVLNGFCGVNEEITVHLLGGDLKIVYDGENVTMTGAAETAFTGEVSLPEIEE